MLKRNQIRMKDISKKTIAEDIEKNKAFDKQIANSAG
jgi:hypothetical protein